MTLKDGFGIVFVICLILQRKPYYREGIVWLVNRVAIWRQSEVLIDVKKVLVMFPSKQTTARKMADQLRTVLIKEHMGL